MQEMQRASSHLLFGTQKLLYDGSTVGREMPS